MRSLALILISMLGFTGFLKNVFSKMSTTFGQNATPEPQTDTSWLNMSIRDGWTRETTLAGRCGLGLGRNLQKYTNAYMGSGYWFWANPESTLAR